MPLKLRRNAMKTKQTMTILVITYGLLTCLLLASSRQSTNRATNLLLEIQTGPRPLSLTTLARVVSHCEENDKPMHPGIIRWASASLPTDDTQFGQTDNSMAAELLWSK